MLGWQRPGMTRDWHSFLHLLPQRLIAALLLWSFLAVPAAPVLSAMTSNAMKCCKRNSKHDCCKRHESGTGTQISGVPECAKGCPSQPGTTAIGAFVILSGSRDDSPEAPEQKFISFEMRAAHAAQADSALFQRPPPTSHLR